MLIYPLFLDRRDGGRVRVRQRVHVEATRRKRFLAFCGSGLVLLRRAAMVERLWRPPPVDRAEKRPYTLLSFVNCEKYPPSLLYLLMTLGPAILLLALLERPAGSIASKICVYGRVPFFYYVLHIPLIHGMAVAVFYAKYGPAVFSYSLANPPPADLGFGLPLVYLFWAAAVVILYRLPVGRRPRAPPRRLAELPVSRTARADPARCVALPPPLWLLSGSSAARGARGSATLHWTIDGEERKPSRFLRNLRRRLRWCSRSTVTAEPSPGSPRACVSGGLA
jgi:hypothetical protein